VTRMGGKFLPTGPALYVLATASIGVALILLGMSPNVMGVGVGSAIVVALFFARDPTWRIAALLALIASNLAFYANLPSGSFLLLFAIFLILDIGRLISLYTRAQLLTLLFAVAYLLSRDHSRYGLLVVAGLLFAFYLRLALIGSNWILLLEPVAVGGSINALVGLSNPGANYSIVQGGSTVLVNRGVAEGLDPNATAGLLLLGLGAAVTIAVVSHGAIRASALLLAIVITAGIASTASRTAVAATMLIALSAVVSAFRGRGRGSASMKLLILPIMGVSAYLIFEVLVHNQSLYRFNLLRLDAGGRDDLYNSWIDTISLHPFSLFFGFGDIPTLGGDLPSLPPHNSLLELAAHFGLVGLIFVIGTLIILWAPTPRIPATLRGTAVALLSISSSIGLLSALLPWIGLTLLLARRERQNGASREVVVPGVAARLTDPLSSIDSSRC